MDLTAVYESFKIHLENSHNILQVEMKKVAGIPFLYIQSEIAFYKLERLIKEASSCAIKGKRLSSQTIYVRSVPPLYVFRHRFFVPQRKIFCCGNLCPDCIRFTSDYY